MFNEKDYVTNHYLQLISARVDSKIPGSQEDIKNKNQRYLQLLKLKEDGEYFSNEKMRQRDPVLFDAMVGNFLDDSGMLLLETANNFEIIYPF